MMSNPDNTDKQFIPEYSADGMSALDIFYSEFNDINFFVEDAEQENLYEVIVRKILPDLKIYRIFPQGGKPAVKIHSENNSAANNVYLLDKDFDDVLGKTSSTDPRVLYLDRFCIENYLLDESAIIEFVIECKPKFKRNLVQTRLDLDNYLKELLSNLKPLFECYFLIQKNSLEIVNCDLAPEHFSISKQRLYCICATKVNRYIANAINTANDPLAKDEFRKIHTCGIFDLGSQEIHSIISGKYLLKLVFHRLKYEFQIGGDTFDSFRYRVAKSCNLGCMSNVARSIKNYAEQIGLPV